MSAPNADNMSRQELIESLLAAEMQRDAVDDCIKKQQDLIKLMERKMDKLSEMTPTDEKEEASDASKPAEDKSET